MAAQVQEQDLAGREAALAGDVAGAVTSASPPPSSPRASPTNTCRMRGIDARAVRPISDASHGTYRQNSTRSPSSPRMRPMASSSTSPPNSIPMPYRPFAGKSGCSRRKNPSGIATRRPAPSPVFGSLPTAPGASGGAGPPGRPRQPAATPSPTSPPRARPCTRRVPASANTDLSPAAARRPFPAPEPSDCKSYPLEKLARTLGALFTRNYPPSARKIATFQSPSNKIVAPLFPRLPLLSLPSCLTWPSIKRVCPFLSFFPYGAQLQGGGEEKARPRGRDASGPRQGDARDYTRPWASMESATFTKPAMFAPAT